MTGVWGKSELTMSAGRQSHHMVNTDNIDHDIELQVLRGISENKITFFSELTIGSNIP